MEKGTLNIGLEQLKNWFISKKKSIGIIGIAAVIMVGLKLVLFYQFMSVQSNFFLIWLITGALIYLLFSSFKNKWTPAVIYLIFSVLMFADVAYASFFNRYLSINMLGAAGFLGDVGASIKAVLKPKFFLLFIDNILIFITLFTFVKRKNKSVSGELEEASQLKTEKFNSGESEINQEKDQESIQDVKKLEYFEENELEMGQTE